MRAHLAGSGLATRKFPEEITEWREPLPRTDSGKLARAALAQGAEERTPERADRLQTTGPLT
jgi:acyl-coenzyme A synthetase/AMP-(fatty) acid ligase